MTLYYLLPAIWGGVLLISFIGYGALLRRLLFKQENVGWANEAASGMMLIIILGGVLNSLYAISRPLILVLIAAGVTLALVDVIMRRTPGRNRLLSAHTYLQEHPYAFSLKVFGYACIVGLVAVQYFYSVGATSGTMQDDILGYFTFPKQMLELGGIAPDMFNGLRLANGLGGQSILHALILVLFDFRNFTLIDGGIAPIICAGLVWRIGEERHLAYPWKWALVLFFLAFPYYPALRINSSSFTTGMVAFLALFAFLDRSAIRAETPVRNALMVALFAASACALKTNLLPPVVIILVLTYLWYLISTRLKKEAVIEACLVPVFVLVMLLPWMIALYRSSGTMLYPVFGMGFDEYRYGNYLAEDFAGGLTLLQKLSIIFTSFLIYDIYLSLIFAGAVAFVVARLKLRAAVQAFALGSLSASLIILLNSDLSNPRPFNRYLFVPVFVSLIAVITVIASEVSRRIGAKQPKTMRQYGAAIFSDKIAAIGLATIFGIGAGLFWYYDYAQSPLDLHRNNYHLIFKQMTVDDDSMLPESERARYKIAQESVPAGEAILSRDNETLLYNYARNPIYNMNNPGSCSPPPGMPYFQGPETVAQYLLSHKIRYVAYTYKNQGGYPTVRNFFRLHSDEPYGHRVNERAKVALDRVLGELGATRVRVYDDGELFILDLKTRAVIAREYREPNYFQIGKILSLAWARTRGFDSNKVWTDGHGVIEDIHYELEAKDKLLVLNTFGYHPWKGNMKKLNLVLSVNGTPLSFVKYVGNAYFFSLASVRHPIRNITIDSATFVPRNEKVRFGMDDDQKILGIDVDTIEIANIGDTVTIYYEGK